jgi:hypothetical protein
MHAQPSKGAPMLLVPDGNDIHYGGGTHKESQ